ncbi:MAG: murein L,D-transpeptidase [Rhodobacterales bacterium]|nr:MAG: murein L,D-transpeptidase [Rhodobacterales bacterium]
MSVFGRRGALGRMIAAAVFVTSATVAQAQSTGFRQAVAGAASSDPVIAEFYKARDFAGLWTGNGARNRRNALLEAFAHAGDHGLPAAKYDPARLTAELNAATSEAQKGQMDVRLTSLYLDYARSIQTGILTPSRVVPDIKREVPLRARASLLSSFAQSNPGAFLRSLPPPSPEYARLLREKLRLERVLATNGWGAEVPQGKLEPGQAGGAVVRLRDRLIAMGYLAPTATQTYDANVQAAVQRAQQAFGLSADGVAGNDTIRALNVGPAQRLQSVIVAMERERWMNRPRGRRHIWVNLTDFTAAIMDNDRATFTTRSVVGANQSDRRSPEFSDVMEFMIINPSWYVPRSIVTKEYLPILQRNRNAVGHIDITDRNGRVVPRSSINFGAYNAQNFPYSMRQPPSNGNALGLVKFMFPNRYNIYLHDTPSKSLFNRQVRAFSHGCIRLGDPFDFAYALLARQVANPEAFFQEKLATGREQRVNLAQPVPVHIVYRTAFTHTTGQLSFRNDVYGRDRAIWNALSAQGVQVRAAAG